MEEIEKVYSLFLQACLNSNFELLCLYFCVGWINDFLSWSGWVVLSRLTYTAYLVHPFVLFCFSFNAGSALHFSIVRMVRH